MYEKERSLYGLVVTDGVHSIRLSVEDRNCLESTYMLSRSET